MKSAQEPATILAELFHRVAAFAVDVATAFENEDAVFDRVRNHIDGVIQQRVVLGWACVGLSCVAK